MMEHDEYWHPHIDQETYSSFHFTSVLYLSDYHRDFTSGRFMFIDKGSKVSLHLNLLNLLRLNRSVEPREGRVSAFSSGIENRHFVEPVSGGSRCSASEVFRSW